VRQFSYLAVLAGCLAGTAPLEVFLHTRVYVRPLRLVLTLLPVVAVFFCWDLYAISAGHWDFDPASTTGALLPGDVPLEELLFFIVVPVCAVLTLEAVRAVKGWEVGDEPTPPAGTSPGKSPGKSPGNSPGGAPGNPPGPSPGSPPGNLRGDVAGGTGRGGMSPAGGPPGTSLGNRPGSLPGDPGDPGDAVDGTGWP
jgi:lycopene cyclase domain-containing protein